MEIKGLILREKVLEILRRYADEQQTLVRGTSDLSPMEEWLLIKIANMELAKEQA